MSALLTQTNFTHGQLSPKMVGRPDLSLYLTGAQRLENCLVIPQGGAQKRFGTTFIQEITASTNEYMLYRFELNDEKNYLLVWTPLKLEIFINDALVHTIVTPYTAAMLEALEVKFTQTENVLVIAHPDIIPHTLVNDGTDATWTFAPANIKFLPVQDFAKNYDSATFTLSATTTGSPRTLTSDIPVFNLAHVDGRFEGLGPSTATRLGIATITGFTSTTSVTVDILSDFDPSFTTGVIGRNVFLAEVAWGGFNDRGWPASCTFFEGRLIFGGSRSLPQNIFGSVVEDFFNFNPGTGLASDAIQETMSTDQVNIIRHVVSDRCLQIFTSSAEFADPQVDGDPLTPSTVAILKQTNNGSENVEPVVIDNQTLYVKKGGKGVMSFTFTETSESYQSINTSIISEDLIKNPIDSATLKGSTRDDADFTFMVNDDGTLAIYQTLAEQDISAWTPANTNQQTEGKFKRVTNVGNDVYFIVERTVNGNVVQYLEKMDFNVFTDCSTTQTFGSPTTIIPGLSHLEGETVQIVGDGFVIEPLEVVGGQIDLSESSPNAVSEITVGLPITSIIEPMPITIQTSEGPATYIPKRLNRIFIDFFESLGIFIEKPVGSDILIPFLQFGPDVLDQPPVPKTGFKEIDILQGWDGRQVITIKQDQPLPMTILAIGYEVNL